MPAPTPPEVVYRIWAFLDLGWSYSMIIKELKRQNIKMSRSLISDIKKRRGKTQENKTEVETRGRKSILSETQLSNLKKWTDIPNPPTQIDMAKRLKTTQQVISYQINKVLNKKLSLKPKGHHLTLATIEKRRKRSWPMYLRLRGERWRKVLTTDEAWFYLAQKKRQTRVQYRSRGQKRSELDVFTKQSHPKGVMVWLGISANGVTKVRFIEPGVKINSDYYIDKVLKPVIRNDIPRLYPNGDCLFQQDSAPSHGSKKTQDYLKTQNLKYITPSQWLPNSPDVAPLDYFFWGYLKRQVNKRNPTTISGLKKVIKEEVAKVSQTMINKALKSWGKRCRQIYYNKGLHIENKK